MINIFKASAGSGKTFTLAREYIKYIIGYKDSEGVYHLNPKGGRPLHRASLAITFTNKATEEMKGRIIHELAVLAGLEKNWNRQSDYIAELTKVFNCTPDDLVEPSREALSSLLFDFNNFNVSTIDAFFQMVLRSFAHEAEVSGNYGIELDDKAVIGVSIDSMLQDLNHPSDGQSRHIDNARGNSYIIAYLTAFMKSLVDQGLSFNLFDRGSSVHESLINFFSDILDDDYRDNESEILEYLRHGDRFKRFREAIDTNISDYRKNCSTACREALTAIDSENAQTKISSRFLTLLLNWEETGYYKSKSASVASLATPYSVMADVLSAYKGKDKENYPCRAVPDPVFIETAKAIIATGKAINLLNIIKKNIYHLGLLEQIMAYIDEYRLQNSSILLSDTNKILSKVIGDANSPFVYEKLGLKFEHYLIDEFQDTSRSQWQNLSPLLDESLSHGYDNLVIGDIKQCIYRFRGSDPSLLRDLHIPYAEGECSVKGDKIKENTNYRSAWNVVRFNNTLFAAMAHNLGISDTYKGVVQQLAAKTEEDPGFVELSMFDGEDPDADALANLATHLRRQLESGYKPGDIAILVRTNLHGQKVMDYLEQARHEDSSFPDFNIVSDNSLLVGMAPSVMHVLSRLRFLSSTDFVPRGSKHSTREVTRILNDFENVFAKTHSMEQALNEALRMFDERNGETGRSKEEAKAIDEVTESDLITIVEAIIASLPDENRRSDAVFISAFQDMVLDFSGKGQSDIRSFLDWWDERGSKTSVAGASDPSAINILTIHKSKGLEFPCVHIPFASSDNNKSDVAWMKIPELPGFDSEIIPPMMPVNISSDLAETPLAERYEEIVGQRGLDLINLLYVAFTRAKNELVIGLRTTEKAGEASRLIQDAISTASSEAFVSTLIAEMSSDKPLNIPVIQLVPENGRITIGEPTIKRETTEKAAPANEPHKGNIIESYDTRPKESPWANTRASGRRPLDYSIARHRGTLLHALLSHIITPADIDKAFAKESLTPEWRNITAEQAEEMKNLLARCVSAPQASEWFTGFRRVITERDVVTSDGTVLRLDRVVWTGAGEVHLIDYKTGNQPEERYKSKIKEYMDFMRSAVSADVHAFLYYLDSGRVVELK